MPPSPSTASPPEVTRAAYRALLRVARRLDHHPEAKALIMRHRSPPVARPRAGRSRATPAARASFTKKALWGLASQVMGDKLLFHPPLDASGNIEGIVRSSFRENTDPDPRKISRQQDVALAALRGLSSVWATHASSPPPPEEPEPPHVHAEPANTLLSGCVLVAHPMVTGELHRSVVLLLDHTEKGSTAVVVNKPSDHTLRTGLLHLSTQLSPLGNNRLFRGGPVWRVSLLHRRREVGGVELPQLYDAPLFYGGNMSLVGDIVAQEEGSASDFMFYAGCCHWSPGQLEEEVGQGVWLPLLAPYHHLTAEAGLADLWGGLWRGAGHDSIARVAPWLSAGAVEPIC